MRKRQVIGLDVGSSSVKAALYSDGEFADISRVEYGSEPGAPFMSSEQIIEAANRSVRKVARRGDIEAIGLSCMFPTFMILNENCDPKVIASGERDVSTWADSYASVDYTMNEGLFHKETGCVPHPQYSLFKAQARRYSVIREGDKIVTLHDYILYTLTGKEAASRSVASTTGFLKKDGSGWSDRMLEAAGLGKEYFFDIVETDAKLTSCCSVPMNSIEPGITVIPGAGDGLLAQLGASAMKQGCVTTTVGTTAAVRTARKEPLDDKINNVWCHYLCGDTFICGNSMSDGMSSLDWIESLFGKKPSETSIGKMDPTGQFFLPFMNGERGPHWRNKMKGGFTGITQNDDYRTMYRSAMEGILLALNECFGAIRKTGRATEIRATGGYVNSPAMLQMQADIFDFEISVPAEKEASAAGAAYLAMKSLGIIDEYPDVRISKVYEPDIYKPAKYKKRIEEFRKLIQ